MSEVVFRDEKKESEIDQLVIRGRNDGKPHREIAKEIGIQKYQVDRRAKRLIHAGIIGYYPKLRRD